MKIRVVIEEVVVDVEDDDLRSGFVDRNLGLMREAVTHAVSEALRLHRARHLPPTQETETP